ncbi:hypothetical protein [Quadrisphaera setariae]|uniref:Uncharacterized protein n=1 Tax=Quadrisphaera setariae TaxID=2593304 RepID=A0A5C8ZEN1_9ACTN|nr:hypothetical protein [Quadrisphaera setariae]TXR56292.1 hypothetical protein FMM08_09210 [Quadrisphaera setariae]
MGGGADEEGLAQVLGRLTDPATSTRRTEQARRRLADDPVTLALLEAGVLVLQRELGTLVPSDGDGDGDGDGERRSLRFLELLSASRVCAAASAVGPLRVTPSHLRDRWARQRDYGEDLLALLLWRRHWDDLLDQRLRHLPAPRTAQDLAVTGEALARAHLVTGALPVSTRLELVASALASEHPALRRSREEHYRTVAARYGQVWRRCYEMVGQRPRAGADLDRTSLALGAVNEGANLRTLATGEAPERVEEAVRLLRVGGGALTRRAFEPDPARAAGAAPAPAGALDGRPLWPGPGSGDLADVLVHLTDPVTGSRRTSAARRRLAHDEITAQLLHGGTGVLGQELGVVASGPGRRVSTALAAPSAFFGLLSAAAVEAAGRTLPAGSPRPTAAQLRDRWRTQDHYVDDLLAYAAHRVRRVRRAVLGRISAAALEPFADGGGGWERLRASLEAAAASVLADVDRDGHDRLRLLLTALAAARPVVSQRLAELGAQEEHLTAGLLAELLARAGVGLRPGVAVEDLARALVALRDGVVLRALATGQRPDEHASAVPPLGWALVEVVAGSLADPPGAQTRVRSRPHRSQ